MLLARSDAGKDEFPKEHTNLRMSIYLGRMAQDPLMEMCVVANSAGTTEASKAQMLKRLALHRYQSVVPPDLLVQKVRTQFRPSE
jgi:transcriptional accessory protein Tex/SPT6